jgi:hypothetical protein
MMSKIYVPARVPADWQNSLARPDKHWKTGYSAWALAHSWQGAAGFPPEIIRLFKSSAYPAFQEAEMLLAIPEYKVLLPPYSGHPSQNDLFVLARSADRNLISITVEGKVEESFGPNLGCWKKQFSAGKKIRWTFLKDKLGLSEEPPLNVRYQLFHRLASAVIEAERYNAKYAVMIIHSFSPGEKCFDDYAGFLDLFGEKAVLGKLVFLKTAGNISILSGWAQGDLDR